MTEQTKITGWLTPEDLARAKELTPQGRLKEIARELGYAMAMDPADILGKSRKADFVRARRLMWFIAHREGMSYAEIARRHGTDHSTVRHGIQREEETRRAEAKA